MGVGDKNKGTRWEGDCFRGGIMGTVWCCTLDVCEIDRFDCASYDVPFEWSGVSLFLILYRTVRVLGCTVRHPSSRMWPMGVRGCV